MYRVIIVEDDPMVLAVNRKYVEQDARFEVSECFRDGQSALEYLQNHVVDLVLLDIYMPRFTGLDLLRRIRIEKINCSVIMITAANDTNCLKEALDLGILDYLIKPFEYPRLKKSLDQFAGRRAAIKKLEKESRIYQQDIDRVFLENKSYEGVQKGIYEKTLEQIRRFLNDRGDKPLSSEEVAEETGLSVVTARKYMNYMAENHEVVSIVDYKTGGRPCVLYKRNI